MEKEIAPDTSHDKQGSTNNNCSDDIKNYPFEVPDTLPGCYGDYGDPGEYRGIDGCTACLYRLPCARMSSRDD